MSSMKHTKIKFKCARLVCAMLALAMLLPLSGCGETRKTQREVFAMDTSMVLTAYGKKAKAGLTAAESVIRSMDSMLDPELSTSIVYQINHASGESVRVSGQVASMLTTAKTVYDRTKGAYDPTIYPLIKRWGFVDGQYYVPTDEEISENLALRCFDKLVLTNFPNSGSFAVQLPETGQLSFASIAKGCASSNAIEAMRQADVTSGIISLGGNVQTLGTRPDGSNWNVGVTDPNDPGSYLGVVSVGETAVITSGTYQRFFTKGAKTYHHLISTTSGYPVNNTLLSVTILCSDGTAADCLSTAMFLLGETKALNYWRTYGGFEMILITNDNQVICTSGLMEKFSLKNTNYTLKYTE